MGFFTPPILQLTMKNNMPLFSTNSKILLYLWVSVYAILWICGSYSLDPTVPYDAVEAVNWGMNGEWGSPKNPWFVGAVMWPAIYLNLSYSFCNIREPFQICDIVFSQNFFSIISFFCVVQYS